MAIITQKIEDLVKFDDSLRKCFQNLDSIKSFPNQIIYRIILVLCLTTGLEMEFIFTLKWKDLLKLGSENDAIVNDELRVRKYLIPIHPKIKFLLSEFYNKLGFPNLNSKIIDMISGKNGLLDLPKIIVGTGSPSMYEFMNLDNKYLNEFDYENYLQILFGRKVFEVNGYTNNVSKYLKQHFGFHLNEELFSFLGYKSKEDIKYHLHSINLDTEGILVQLEDKNFNDGDIPFQKFTAFSKFLLPTDNSYISPVSYSIRLLLVISLYNGIRPSKLLQLKWHDFIQVNEEEKSIEIRKNPFIDKQRITIGKEIRERLLYHFQLSMERTRNIKFYSFGSSKKQYSTKPITNNYVFVMNTENPITQPSLSREIKKTLIQLKFPHAKKMISNSTLIMYGRRIIEIKGDHKPTIKKLKEHFNFKSKKELFEFLYLGGSKSNDKYNFKGKIRKNIFEDILYDL